MQRTHSIAEHQTDAELTITPEAAAALESGSVGDPFSLLGPQAGSHGVIVRAYVPPADAVAIIDAQDQVLAHMVPIAPPGTVCRTDRRAVSLPTAHPVAWRGHPGHRGSVFLRAAARGTGCLSARGGQSPRVGALPRCAGDEHRRRCRRALRCLGAQRAPRIGGRRFQRLGRSPSRRCASASRPASGSCSYRAYRSARSTSTKFSGPSGCCR